MPKSATWRALVLIAIFILLGVELRPTAVSAARITAPGKAVAAFEKEQGDFPDSSTPSTHVLCDLVLEDEEADGRTVGISKGDADQLKQKFEELTAKHSSIFYNLCLRSGGGDITEALEIAKFVRETQRPSMTTVVEDGQLCASACALIFMAGNTPSRIGEFPARVLHPRGRLNFHSSRLDFGALTDVQLLEHLTQGGKQRLREGIAGLYEEGLRDEQATVSTFNSLSYIGEDVGRPWVRPSLFMEVFAQAPNEWVCIDNVDKVGRWDIDVYDFAPPERPTDRQLYNACRNVYFWRNDQFAATSGIRPPRGHQLAVSRPPLTMKIGGRDSTANGFAWRAVVPVDFARRYQRCIVEGGGGVNEEGGMNIFYDYGEDRAVSEIYNANALALFPPDTPLSALPGIGMPEGSSEAQRQSPRSYRHYDNSRIEGCALRILTTPNVESCETACTRSARCAAYSFGKMSHRCSLKHTVSALRFDPLSVTGSLALGQQPRKSIRIRQLVDLGGPYAFTQLRQEIGEDADFIVGEELDQEHDQSQARCTVRCATNSDCVAFEHYEQGGVCRRFSRLDGFRPQRAGETLPSLVELKRQ